MQVGDTVSAQYVETQATAFQVNVATLTITYPDNSTVSPTVSVTGQNTPALSHTVTAPITAALPGQYNLTWSMGDGTYTWVRQQTRFAFANNVPFMVRDRLRRPISLLPDPIVEYAFNTICRQFYTSYANTGIGGYGTLSAFDQQCIDEGLAILTALRLRRYSPITTPSGELSSWKVQQVEYKFVESAIRSTGAIFSNLTPDEQWFRDAYEILNRISFLQAQQTKNSKCWSTWRVTGPSRRQLQSGPQSLWSVMASLLSDDHQWNSAVYAFGTYFDYALWP